MSISQEEIRTFKGVVKVKKNSLNSFLYPSVILLHLPHPSILLLNVLISSEKSSLPVLLSVTAHSNARLPPWCGESLLRGEGRAGWSGRPLTQLLSLSAK